MAEKCGSLVGVEFHDLTNKNGCRVARVRVREVRVVGNPIGPGRKSLEVQAVEFGQIQEHDWVGPLDQAPLDLGQVRVRPADASFDLAERELAVHARAPQDAADMWATLSVCEIGLDRRSSCR